MIVHSGYDRPYFVQFVHSRRNESGTSPVSLLRSRGMVDVAGIEPATPCLQSTRVPSHDSIPYFGFQRFQPLGESAFRSKLTPMESERVIRAQSVHSGILTRRTGGRRV